MQQAHDFRAEVDDLAALTATFDAVDYARATQFKGWTVNQVLQHLHLFDIAADMALSDPGQFLEFKQDFRARQKAGGTMTGIAEAILGDLRGPALREAWLARAHDLASRFAEADPRARVQWMGPEMSVRTSVTARQMETWAHGQELYDLMGLVRTDTDRIRNICVMGVNTFAWTFLNRGMAVPETAPQIRLTAPSGEIWSWNEDADDRVEGRAVEFCQVVTQTRNVADTGLTATGTDAATWMSLAQCFAGSPEDPPAPGTRGAYA